MGTDSTGTYSQAKQIFDSLDHLEYTTIKIDSSIVPIFRKHLVEMQRRKGSAKRFATRILNKNQLKITRIE